MAYRKLHSAKCSCCGYVARTEEGGDFISSFFLPDFCEGCGETMFSGYYAERNKWAHWVHAVSKQRFVAPVKTRNPLTWLRMGRWEEVEQYDLGVTR